MLTWMAMVVQCRELEQIVLNSTPWSSELLGNWRCSYWLLLQHNIASSWISCSYIAQHTRAISRPVSGSESERKRATNFASGSVSERHRVGASRSEQARKKIVIQPVIGLLSSTTSINLKKQSQLVSQVQKPPARHSELVTASPYLLYLLTFPNVLLATWSWLRHWLTHIKHAALMQDGKYFRCRRRHVELCITRAYFVVWQ